MIPDDLADRIRERIDIISIISEHINLKKSGQNYKGLCPFHSEKTPSFTVSPAKQIFHCFGCGAGGNVFHFLMRYDNLTFPQALRYLGERAGIKIPEPGKREGIEKDNKEELYKANELAAEYFYNNLAESREAEEARGYLKKRGIENKTIEEFKIGYSLPQWEAAYRYLRQKGIDAATLEKAGLIIKKENGFYDRFRGRIIFPILDLKKRVIGFGGRVIDDSLPKYINSPESPIYIKGENLYCLEKARQEIVRRGYLLIVEGYLDAIMTYQKGVRNTAATLGTALTQGHIRLIKRFTNNLILIFDPDAAGKKAAIRSAPLFLEAGMKVKVAALTEGTDPDTFLRKNGVDAFVERLKNSERLFDFVFSEVRGKDPLTAIDDKMKAVNELLPLINGIPGRIEKNLYIKRLAEGLGIDETDILAELKALSQKKALRSGEKARSGVQPQKPAAHRGGAKAEEMLIHIMLNDEAIARKVRGHLGTDDFRDPNYKKVAGIIYRAIDEGKGLNDLSGIDDPVVANLLSSLSIRDLEYDDLEQSFNDCVQKIKGRGIKDRMRELQERLSAAEKKGDTESRRQILNEMKELKSVN